MTERPARVVDAHMHIWDPARTDWYPYLQASGPAVPGGSDAMKRLHDVATYKSETAGWNVEKFVNVAAATGRNSIDETIELDRLADERGGPHAIVGGLPPTDTVAEAIELIDRQMAASRFRGVRSMGGFDLPVPEPEVLRALQERDLAFELMTRTDKLVAAASRLEEIEDLVVVVEHTGWPRPGGDDERKLWEAGIDALAGIGGNVYCKLSGLAMPFKSMHADVLAPWIEHAIQAFGVDRCMFASNFPVDAAFGTFAELYETYSNVTAGLDKESRDRLFAANAERVFRL